MFWKAFDFFSEYPNTFLYFLRSWDRASLMYSVKYNQQDATLYNSKQLDIYQMLCVQF
jgi:hypothetical protein